jgi:NAD(P)H-dependent nitrite reductase small subunit
MTPGEKEYVFVARAADFPRTRGLVRTINEHEIAVFRIDGAFYAVSNICPHQHSPLIAEGIIEGLTVTCPLHGWKYSLVTGRMEEGAGGIRTYPVKVEGDKVYVEKPDLPPMSFW